MNLLRWLPMVALLAAHTVSADEYFMGGRPVNPDKSFSISLSGGQVQEISGSVNETTRRLFELEGRDPSSFDPESYSFAELGIEDSYATVGFTMEKMWRYITLRGDLSYMQADASSSPPRDFFIGVSDIEFEGRSYEYMKLEEGVPFDATLDALLISFSLQYTPFTLGADHVLSFTPFVHAGFFAIVGTFDIEQGEAKRIQIYENPPREYVVGGNGDGDMGGFAPEIGIGGELRLWLGRNEYGDRELAVQGTYAIFEYDGSSDALGISSRNEKDLDVDYDMIEVRAAYYLPISAALDLIIGAEYKIITADAESKSKARTLEEALVNREKYDKQIDLEITTINAFVGLRF
jgi:hypothetical protein